MTTLALPYPTFVLQTIINPAQVNANNAAIVSVVNGALDNTNISLSANIALSKLALAPGSAAFNKTTTGAQTWGSGLITDTQPQIAMTADKGLLFGPGGTTAPDVLLIRSAANTLQLNIPGGGAGVLDMNSGTIINWSGGAVITKLGTVTTGTWQATPVAPLYGGTGSTLFTFGTATFLSAGSVAVADTSITANSIIIPAQKKSTPAAEYFSYSVNAGVGFTLYSSNSSSTAVLGYMRVG